MAFLPQNSGNFFSFSQSSYKKDVRLQQSLFSIPSRRKAPKFEAVQFGGIDVTQNKINRPRFHLHDESLEADLFKVVGLVVVKVEVVVEDEAVLHVRRHLDPDRRCT